MSTEQEQIDALTRAYTDDTLRLTAIDIELILRFANEEADRYEAAEFFARPLLVRRTTPPPFALPKPIPRTDPPE